MQKKWLLLTNKANPTAKKLSYHQKDDQNINDIGESASQTSRTDKDFCVYTWLIGCVNNMIALVSVIMRPMEMELRPP